MAEKQTAVDTTQDFFCEEYGWIDAHQRKKVRADIAARWIEEGKALPVMAGDIETPEDAIEEHETADLKRKKK